MKWLFVLALMALGMVWDQEAPTKAAPGDVVGFNITDVRPPRRPLAPIIETAFNPSPALPAQAEFPPPAQRPTTGCGCCPTCTCTNCQGSGVVTRAEFDELKSLIQGLSQRPSSQQPTLATQTYTYRAAPVKTYTYTSEPNYYQTYQSYGGACSGGSCGQSGVGVFGGRGLFGRRW